jgi:hypothetical protein
MSKSGAAADEMRFSGRAGCVESAAFFRLKLRVSTAILMPNSRGCGKAHGKMLF